MVAEAKVLIVLPSERICLISKITESFPGTVVAVAIETSLNKIVKVAAALAVFATRILLTNVVVGLGVVVGTVYTVEALVVAAPLDNALNVLAIYSPYSPTKARPSIASTLAVSAVTVFCN